MINVESCTWGCGYFISKVILCHAPECTNHCPYVCCDVRVMIMIISGTVRVHADTAAKRLSELLDGEVSHQNLSFVIPQCPGSPFIHCCAACRMYSSTRPTRRQLSPTSYCPPPIPSYTCLHRESLSISTRRKMKKAKQVCTSSTSSLLHCL